MSAARQIDGFPEPGELLELLSALRDGELDRDRLTRLDQLLAEPRNRQLYLEYMHLRASLIWDHANDHGAAGDSSDSTVAEPQLADSRRRSPVLGFMFSALPSAAMVSRPLVLLFVIASSIGAMLVAWSMVRNSDQVSPVAQKPVAAPQMVAQLARTQEARWSQGSPALSPHAWLTSGQKLELSDGMAEISFPPRALVVMQGPASFTVGNEGGVLGEGKLIVSVPQASQGFSVATPWVTIASSESQFGVAVEADGVAQIHVFQGDVALALNDPQVSQKELRLKAGEAIRIDGRGEAVKLASVVAPPMPVGRRS